MDSFIRSLETNKFYVNDQESLKVKAKLAEFSQYFVSLISKKKSLEKL